MKRKNLLAVILIFIIVTLMCGFANAKDFRIIIMQDDKDAAAKYAPLLNYLKKNRLNTLFVTAPNYLAAATMFAGGKGDAMISGSGIAATLMIKELATPVARPVSKEGISTYHAVVIAPKGTAKFTGKADFFSGKRVLFTALASAGEFFYHSIPNIKSIKSTVLIAASHGAALDALSRGAADVAIIKDLVWEKNRNNYPGLELIGEDNEKNPDMTFMVSNKVDAKTTATLLRLLLAVNKDTSPEAQEVMNKLAIKEYIVTTKADFKHTLELLKAAGVSKSFSFKF